MDYESRVREVMSQLEDEILAICPGPNMKYLTGVELEQYERHTFFFVAKENAKFFVPELLEEKVEETGYEVVSWDDTEGPQSMLRELFKERSWNENRLLLDERMREHHSSDLRKLSEGKPGLAEEVMRPLRMVKTEEEIEAIESASEIADAVMEKVRAMGDKAIGMTEKELSDFIGEKMVEEGGEGESFSPVVAAGGNGAKPHHKPSDSEIMSSEIRSGEPVVVDFGCWKKGYPSDISRTLVFDGEPSENFLEIFDIVERAQKAAMEKVEPGSDTGEVDKAARSVIRDAGYGDRFIHRTGHGIGVEVHDVPKIPEVVREQVELKEDMVFTIEPGIYIEGEFGIRIEDVVKVTEDGCERLNLTSRSFSL